MSTTFYVMLVSGALLFSFVLLFRTETVSQQRFFLSHLRGRADRYLETHAISFLRMKRLFGASSLRLFMHYVLHQVLSVVLYVVRFTESRLQRLRLKNKVVAKVIKSKNENSHLFHLKKHRETNPLSLEEQDRIKGLSFRG